MKVGSVVLIGHWFSIIGVKIEVSTKYAFEISKHILLCILQKILNKLIILKTLVYERKYSRSLMSNSLHPHGLRPPGSSVHGILQARILVGGHSLLQGIFLTQGSNPGPPHCRQILYYLSQQRP